MSRTRNKKNPRTGGKDYERKENRRDENSVQSGKQSGSETQGDTGKEESTSSSVRGIPSAQNDPEWYSRDPRLVIDAASIPFSKPFGDKLDLHKGIAVGPGPVTIPNTVSGWPIPGIMSLVLKPSFGYSGDKTSPVNVCANALYTHVRYINSGRKNYDPADLFMYVGAFGDIYSFLCWCIRLYQYAFMYSQRNWYIGRDLILANHVDADNLVRNLANFRYWINSVINKVSSFCIPGDIYYFKRRVFLYSNYYLENPYGNIKDQLYQLVPEGFYAFAFDSNGAGKLKYEPMQVSGSLMNITYIQAYFESILMANITGDEDFGLMSGDILKAYGDNIIHIAQIGEDGGLMPVHDPYVLSQFKNAFGCNFIRADATKTFKDPNGTAHVFGDLEQSTDGLLISCETATTWEPGGGNGNYRTGVWAAGQHIVSVETPDPNPGDVIEATRLMPFLGLYPDNTGSGTYFYALNGGTELAVGMKMTVGPAPSGSSIGGTIQNEDFVGDPSALTVGIIRDRTAFKYMPITYMIHLIDTNTLDYCLPVGNLDNTTLIDNDILKRLHDVAMLSLFYVPGVAKIVS